MLLLHEASSMASVSHKLKGKPKNSSSLEISPPSKLFLLPALIRQLQGSKRFHILLLLFSFGTFFPTIYGVPKGSTFEFAERGNCLGQLLGGTLVLGGKCVDLGRCQPGNSKKVRDGLVTNSLTNLRCPFAIGIGSTWPWK